MWWDLLASQRNLGSVGGTIGKESKAVGKGSWLEL